jgi:hypothetical protein
MSEGDEGLVSGFSPTRSCTNVGMFVVANEAMVATCPSRSLTAKR